MHELYLTYSLFPVTCVCCHQVSVDGVGSICLECQRDMPQESRQESIILKCKTSSLNSNDVRLKV